MNDMKNPILPVYLNENNVFDLLAMLTEGIATVTSVSSREAKEEIKSREMSGSLGLGTAFNNLFRVDLSGKSTKSGNNESELTRNEERVHTAASLLFQLREKLSERKMLVIDFSKNLPAPGDIVEVECTLTRNPILETLESYLELMKIADIFVDEPQAGNKQKNSSQRTDLKRISSQIAALIDSLKLGNTLDLVGFSSHQKFETVVTLDKSFLNDPFMANLVDGQFKTLGKVVRASLENGDPISLLRKTALGKSPEVLKEFLDALNKMNDGKMFKMPEMRTEINGPAIQILPIAIYA